MITFETHDASFKTVQIGGTSTFSGDTGVVGPFPKYSIERQNITTGDGTYINSKYNITVNGVATIKSNDDQDITTPGKRQSRIQGEAIVVLQVGRHIAKSQASGRLKINPYGGLANKLTFNNAKLISIELPSQDDENAGVQNLNFSFTFEAYDEVSVGDNTGALAQIGPDFQLSSVEEEWDLSENDGFFLDGSTSSGTVNKTYTLTHNVSATGLKKYDGVGALVADGEAFRQAVQWVETRLTDDPTTAVTTDTLGDDTFFSSTFKPIDMNKPSSTDDLGFDLTAGTVKYGYYNHTRSVTHKSSEGSYSVTDTWLLSDQDFVCTHSLEADVEADESAPYTTVSLSATFTGLSSNASSSKETDSYSNALASFNQFKSTAFTFANSVYSDAGVGGTLNSSAVTETIGTNKTSGIITYSVSFNDRESTIPGAISESVNVSYSNQYGIVDVYAVVQVIGKMDGPIIQDFETTPIFKTDISVDITMEKGYGKPDGTLLSIDNRPAGDPKCASFTESWNPITRSYNLTESWETMPL